MKCQLLLMPPPPSLHRKRRVGERRQRPSGWQPRKRQLLRERHARERPTLVCGDCVANVHLTAYNVTTKNKTHTYRCRCRAGTGSGSRGTIDADIAKTGRSDWLVCASRSPTIVLKIKPLHCRRHGRTEKGEPYARQEARHVGRHRNSRYTSAGTAAHAP